MDPSGQLNRSLLFLSVVGGGACGFASGLAFGVLVRGPGAEVIPAAVGLAAGLVGGLIFHFARAAAVKWLTHPGGRGGPESDYDDQRPPPPPAG
jgi:hypothetical protein